MGATPLASSSSSSLVVVFVIFVISVAFPSASSHDGGIIPRMMRRRYHSTTSAVSAFAVVVENRRRRTTGVDVGVGRTTMIGAADGRTTTTTKMTRMLHSISRTATSSSSSSSSSSPPPRIVDVIDTLDDVYKEYGYLFPRTANCIRALSSSTSSRSMSSSMEARSLPSVEEFLDGLSSEFHLASSSSPSSSSSSSIPPTAPLSSFDDENVDPSKWQYDDVHHLVGSMAPSFASSIVALAAAGAASNEGLAAIDAGSSSVLRPTGSTSDTIVGRLNLPHYRIELPTMTNPFSSEESPSMQGAFSSIGAAVGASEERLGGVLDAFARSFEGMSDGMSDGIAVHSKSFEGLSGRMTAVGGEAAAAVATSLDRSPLITDVADELSDSLHSTRISDLELDGLQHIQQSGDTASNEGLAVIDPGTSSMPHVGGSTSDSIMSQLDRLNLPHYHLELPIMTNPFSSEASPSMQGALSSIKAAAGASEEKLGGVLDAFMRSFEDLSGEVADASKSFEGLSGRMVEASGAGATGMKALANSLQGGASKIAEFRPIMEASSPNLNIVDGVVPLRPPEFNMEMNLPDVHIFDGTSAALRRIGDASLSDFGNAVLYTVELTGGIVVKFLDLILNAVSGTSVASILANVQYSVTTAMDDASHAVVGTLTSIGNMSLIEVFQRILMLVIVITDVLLKIMNAILYIISGKDGAAWAIQATTSIDGASTQLLAKASSAYVDLTHTSLTELAHSIGDYGQFVGDEFVTLIASVSNALNGMSLEGLSLPEDVSDGVASALQTVFSL